MTEKTVLFVGLAQDQIAGIPIPDTAGVMSVATCDEAIDRLCVAPPDLIIANDTIGEIDSLEFFSRVIETDPESSTPVVFLATEGSGLEPFSYQRRRAGFEVRYLDSEGVAHTHFIAEPTTDKTFTVRSLRREGVSEEVARFLGDGALAGGVAEEDLVSRLMEIGFNQDLNVDGVRYHIQTEVVATEPITVATTIFNAGRTVHANQQEIKQKQPSLTGVRLQVEALHATAVGRVSDGELK